MSKNSLMNKLKELKLESLNDLTEEQINVLYKLYQNNKKEEKKANVKPKNIDKTTDKYKVALKFINKILENIKKDQIDDLTDFKNIDRLDIIKPENKIVLEEMESEIFKHFSKIKCGYYRKSEAGDNYTINCLRGMIKIIGLKLNFIQKEQVETIDNKKYKRTHLIYSIINL